MGEGLANRIQTLCPPIAHRLAAEWNLTLLDELPGASASLVLAAQTHDGRDVVMKVPILGDDEVESWKGILAFSGFGGVSLLKVDKETGTVLMPRLRPGTKLGESGLSDLESVDVCADLILGLRKVPVRAATPLPKWFQELEKAPQSAMVTEAKTIALHLIRTNQRVTNLHGDLHQYNIIRGENRWVVIDPKYLLGDPSHEVVGFMRNDMKKAKDAKGMRARLERFSEKLGDPIERLWGWAFAQTVLCCTWDSSPTDEIIWEDSVQAIWEAKP